MNNDSGRAQRQKLLRATYGTWGQLIRGEDGRLDAQRQIAMLQALGLSTFNYFISRNEFDWDDCQHFLPLAAEAGLKVWITILSPWQGRDTRFGPEYRGCSAPFGTDYVAWFDAFGQLAAEHANLECVSIDDFDRQENFEILTTETVAQMIQALHQNRNDIAFCPTIYGVTPTLLEEYIETIDGVMLWWANLDTRLGMKEWLWANRTIVAGRFPIIAGVYARSTTWHPAPPTVKTFRGCLRAAQAGADGVMIFRPALAAGQDDPIVAYLMEKQQQR